MAPERVLGRGDELARIERFITDFPQGSHALVIAGEAGIGKTVLWAEAERLARSRSDLTVLIARATEAEASLAYVVLTDLLEPIASATLPILPRPQAEALAAALLLDRSADPAMRDPRTIGTAVLGTLRHAAAVRPVILAIDDAQWIDPASAAALEFALRRSLDDPIGLIATIRTSESSVRPSLTTVHGDASVAVEVGPISLGVLHQLIRDRTDVVPTRPQLVRLEAASRGNPLLAIEIARELARLDRWPIAGEPLPVPGDMASLLGERIGRMTETDRDVLFVAAAIGSPTRRAISETLDAVDVDVGRSIDHGIDAGFLVDRSDDRLRFVHPLMAEAALRAVTPVRARALHARLADTAATIEDQGRHVALAADGPSAAAAATLDDAATSARRRGATSMAAEWAEAAARLTPGDAPDLAAARSTRAGRWFAESGQVERAQAILREAVAAMPAGDARAAARLVLAQIAGWEHGPAAVIRDCQAALADALDPELRARIRLRMAGQSDELGTAAALEQAGAAIRELESMSRDPDPDLLACALLQTASVRFEGGLGDDIDAVRRAAGLLADQPRQAPDGDVHPESLRAHAMVWQWAVDHDDFEAGRRAAALEIRRNRDLGLDRPLPIGEADFAILAAWIGDMDEAEAHALAAMEAAALAATREGRSAALSGSAYVRMLRGDLGEAESLANDGLALSSDRSDWLAARHRATLGSIALARGGHLAATRILGALFDDFVELGQLEALSLRFAGDLVEAAVSVGDLERARAVVASLERRVAFAPRPWVATMAARGRALVLAAEGDLDGAAAAVDEAVELGSALPMPIERARSALIAGRIARRRKERRRAGEYLDRAIAGFREVGAKAWLAIAEAERSRVGHRTQSIDELTETEDLVARLAAAGKTNRQVGEAAFLTAKSVEGVLSRVYQKLGIRSRAELGAWLAAQDRSGSLD